VRFTYILLSTSSLFDIFFCYVNALQAMGVAMPSLIVNVSRQGLIFIPALFILGSTLGVDGLIWAQPAADVLALILAVSLHTLAFKKMIHSPTPSKA
jgi:Na+-driven multidrug efflux pump